MHSQRSLVFFSLLIQAAAGSVWCLQLNLWSNSSRVEVLLLDSHLLANLFLILAGLISAMAHLGSPQASLQAYRNLKHSWLSREILTVNIFAGILSLMYALTLIRPGLLNGWTMLTASLSAGAALYAMTRVYCLRTVPSWNHAGTPLTFLGSALLLGGLVSLLVPAVQTAFWTSGNSTEVFNLSKSIAFTSALAGIVLKVLAAVITLHERSDKTIPVKPLMPVKQAAGVALWMGCIFSRESTGIHPFLMVVAAISIAAAEISHRSAFYEAYQREGL